MIVSRRVSERGAITISEPEEIIRRRARRQKEDETYREEALNATYLLQNGHRGYTAVWNHIMKISVADLKKNYANLECRIRPVEGRRQMPRPIFRT